MAEKEERILVKKEINYHPPYGGWRGDGKEIVLPRQEIIEKMAKARYAQRPCYDKHGNEISFEDAKQNYQLFYEDLIKEVEPLLNALLEDK